MFSSIYLQIEKILEKLIWVFMINEIKICPMELGIVGHSDRSEAITPRRPITPPEFHDLSPVRSGFQGF